MKNLIASIVLILISCSISPSQPQDSNVVWSTPMWPVNAIFNSPDGRFIYCNQNQRSRFLKIDAMTGQIIDSVNGKGLIMGISPDWKYLYTSYSTFESLKKRDINTYMPVDSINDLQDIWEKNPRFDLSLFISNAKLGNDGKIYLSLTYGKYALVSLNADNLEIIEKRLTSDISDSIYSVEDLAISPNGSEFVTRFWYQTYDSINHTYGEFSRVYLFDVNGWKPKTKLFDGQISTFGVFNFSPDGKFFALRDSILKIYDTKDFLLKNYINMSLHGFDFSNDSKLIAVSVGATVHILNLQEFSEICTQEAHSTLTLKFTSDDRFIYDFNVANGMLTKSKSCAFNTGISNPDTGLYPIIIVNPILNELSATNLHLADGIYEYQIADLKANMLLIGKADVTSKQCKLNIGALPNGLYFFTINDTSNKFMVTR